VSPACFDEPDGKSAIVGNVHDVVLAIAATIRLKAAPEGKTEFASGESWIDSKSPRIEERISLERPRLIIKNMDVAFGTAWKKKRLEDAGKYLTHLIEGDAWKAIASFKQACEKRRLPDRIRVDRTVRKD
jgi:hypothetical protein